MADLKPCPCGKTPNMLVTMDGNQGGKWHTAFGDCCGDWAIEFRASLGSDHNSTENKARAIEEWNNVPRGEYDALVKENKELKLLLDEYQFNMEGYKALLNLYKSLNPTYKVKEFQPHPDTYPPYNPVPIMPQTFPPIYNPKTSCSKCGLVFNGPMGYSCNRLDCPSGIVYCASTTKGNE